MSRKFQANIDNKGLVDRVQFSRSSGLADEFDPWTLTFGVDFSSGKQPLDVRRGDSGIDGLHDHVELGFLAFGLTRICGQVFEPRLRKFINA